MKSIARVLLLSAGLFVLATPGSARASGTPGPLLVEDEALPALALLYTAAPMLVLDVVLLAIDKPLPPALSVLEITIIGLLIPIGVLATIEDSGFERPERHTLTGMAIASLISFPAHGIYSIWLHEEREKAKRNARADALWRGDAAHRSLHDD